MQHGGFTGCENGNTSIRITININGTFENSKGVWTILDTKWRVPPILIHIEGLLTSLVLFPQTTMHIVHF